MPVMKSPKFQDSHMEDIERKKRVRDTTAPLLSIYSLQVSFLWTNIKIKQDDSV